MNKRHRNVETGTRSKTYTNREQGWDVIATKFEWRMDRCLKPGPGLTDTTTVPSATP